MRLAVWSMSTIMVIVASSWNGTWSHSLNAAMSFPRKSFPAFPTVYVKGSKSSCRLTLTALIIDQLSRDNIPTHSAETIEVLVKELPECYHICSWWSKSRINDALRKSGTNVIFITIIPRRDIPMSHTCAARRHVETNHDFTLLLDNKFFLTCQYISYGGILHLQLHSKLISFGTSNWQTNLII